VRWRRKRLKSRKKRSLSLNPLSYQRVNVSCP
jgi:hypothetical protein